MPAPKPQDVLSYDIAQLVQYHHVEHKTLQEAAELIGVSKRTIKRMKKSDTYHDLATQAAESQGEPIENWVASLIKIKNEGGNERNKLSATIKGLDIFGAEPPKKEEHSHIFQAMSDDELRRQIENSIVNEEIASSPSAGRLEAAPESLPEPAVAEGEQSPRPVAVEEK